MVKAARRERGLVQAAFELAAEIEAKPVQNREYSEAKLVVGASASLTEQSAL